MQTCLNEKTIKILASRCAFAAREAAKFLPTSTSLDSLFPEKKGPFHEEVTFYDRKLEMKIKEHLQISSHKDSYLGEETGEVQGSSGVRWIIDPIDGTLNFIRQIPSYAISIAAEVQEQIIAGAIYDPSHQELFTAGLGMGAYCNGMRIYSTETENLSKAIVSTGFSKNQDIRRKQALIFSKLLLEVRDIRSCGSAALELCWLAAGRVDAYYEHDLKYWDLAAGSLIAREAKAVVTIENNLVVAANPLITQDLRPFLK